MTMTDLHAETARLLKIGENAVSDLKRAIERAYVMDDAFTHIRALDVRVRELERDASRYRWLRDNDADFPSVFLKEGRDDSGWFPVDGLELDTAIDAAATHQETASKEQEQQE